MQEPLDQIVENEGKLDHLAELESQETQGVIEKITIEIRDPISWPFLTLQLCEQVQQLKQ